MSVRLNPPVEIGDRLYIDAAIYTLNRGLPQQVSSATYRFRKRNGEWSDVTRNAWSGSNDADLEALVIPTVRSMLAQEEARLAYAQERIAALRGLVGFEEAK